MNIRSFKGSDLHEALAHILGSVLLTGITHMGWLERIAYVTLMPVLIPVRVAFGLYLLVSLAFEKVVVEKLMGEKPYRPAA